MLLFLYPIYVYLDYNFIQLLLLSVIKPPNFSFFPKLRVDSFIAIKSRSTYSATGWFIAEQGELRSKEMRDSRKSIVIIWVDYSNISFPFAPYSLSPARLH